ncbi:MAG TPA: DUF190 domain-containing protein [Candidatus Sulfopaludibacter sp.]|nr:DUF190 domain-containing protein [Candidatus Sulfopaludibacter sp.]
MFLRIFIRQGDRWQHKALHEAIVLKAREMHLDSATVLRRPMGFGQTSRWRTAKTLRPSLGLPLVIEIADSEEKNNHFLPVNDETTKGGSVTLQNARVIDCRSDEENAIGARQSKS